MSDPTAPEPGPAAPATAAAPGSQARFPRALGRYQLLGRLGRGGMGAVFRAHDTQLDRFVALKVPFLGGGGDEDLRQRFFREARAAAALHHPNICPVFDVGEFDGRPYLTMAYIEGPSLSAAMESGRVFTPKQAALLVRKLALAMQAAHAAGVVHRDLKPANVLLRPDGEPVVTDFGLARRDDDKATEGLTRQGDVLGTVEYMPPEQFDSDLGAVGPASDVYALGVVLYELLAGRRPFAGTPASVMAAVLFKPPPPPSALRPDVPAALEAICLRAMAKKPADRYPTMAAFAAALTAFVKTDAGVVSTSPVPPPGPSAAETPPPRLAETKPLLPASSPRVSKPAADPGWEVVEEPAAAPPRSAKKARLVKPRKKRASNPWRPVVLGGAAFGAACLSLVVAAVVVRSGDRGGSAPPPAPVTAPSPAPPKAAPTPAKAAHQPHSRSSRPR